ncbi:MAG: hypothetical protein PVH88_03800 [Ignavibacteria bacterium]|jgi:hypothetical protein
MTIYIDRIAKNSTEWQKTLQNDNCNGETAIYINEMTIYNGEMEAYIDKW